MYVVNELINTIQYYNVRGRINYYVRGGVGVFFLAIKMAVIVKGWEPMYQTIVNVHMNLFQFKGRCKEIHFYLLLNKESIIIIQCFCQQAKAY